MKNVAIDIGSVAVDGLAAAPRSGEAIGRGIERALGRLLAERGLPADLGPRDAASLVLPDLRLPADASDGEIAEAVAAALHRGLGRGI